MMHGIHGACGRNGLKTGASTVATKTDANIDIVPLHQPQREQTIAVPGATWASGTGKLMVIAGTDIADRALCPIIRRT
jgi:hypothetical protein